MLWSRFLLAAVTGALLGGSAAAVLAADPQDARRLADSLVPDGARVVNVFENTGHPWVVGGYFVSVDAEGVTREDLLVRAEAVNANLERTQVFPGGLELDGRRDRVELDISLQPEGFASIKATPTGPSVLLYGLGGAATAVTAVAALRRRSLRERGDRPSLPHGQPVPDDR